MGIQYVLGFNQVCDIVLTAELKQKLYENLKLEKQQWKRVVVVTSKVKKQILKTGKWPCGCCGKGIGTYSQHGVQIVRPYDSFGNVCLQQSYVFWGGMCLCKSVQLTDQEIDRDISNELGLMVVGSTVELFYWGHLQFLQGI